MLLFLFYGLFGAYSSYAQQVILDWEEPLFQKVLAITPPSFGAFAKKIRVNYSPTQKVGSSAQETVVNLSSVLCGSGHLASFVPITHSIRFSVPVHLYFREIQRDPQLDRIPCLGGSATRVLENLVVHELSHALDHKLHVSSSDAYRRLVDERDSLTEKIRNRNVLASPDAYEFEDTSESFAVNFTYFILDPLYPCRRPAFYKVIKQATGFFSETPPDQERCKDYSSLILLSQYRGVYKADQILLDSKRIYAVHYILGGVGDAVESRFGHGMFRIIVCAPDRTDVSAECLKDVGHHLVFGYAAPLFDQRNIVMKGIFGGLQTMFTAKRWTELESELGTQEFRDIYGVDLRFTPKEISSFVEVSLDRFWHYRSSYLYLTNNCGTEAKRHLRIVDENKYRNLRSFSPSQLLKKICLTLPDEVNTSMQSYNGVKSEYVVKHRLPLYQKILSRITGRQILTKEEFKNFNDEPVDSRIKTYKEALNKNPGSTLFPAITAIENRKLQLLGRELMGLVQQSFQESKSESNFTPDELSSYKSLKAVADPVQYIFLRDRKIKDRSAYGIPSNHWIKDNLLVYNERLSSVFSEFPNPCNSEKIYRFAKSDRIKWICSEMGKSTDFLKSLTQD